MSKKIVIVGGVAGGASAAARLRRVDEKAEIILFEKGEHISFANCGLPYYIGGVIKDKENLLVQTPEKMKDRFNIDVRVFSEVVKIDRDKKTVEVKNTKTGATYHESYDNLVLSPGAEPIKPNLLGIEGPRVFTLRNIPDTYKIKDFVDEKKPKRAIVVGAGFIGLEVAENLHLRGVKVTVVELADHVIGPLDFDMAAIVHQHMKTKEVEFYLKDGVKGLQSEIDYINVELTSGRVLKADMVIMGIGVKPETRIANEAGLKIGVSGGIEVNEYMQTSDENIYAVGDAVEVKDFISGNPALIPLAGPANKQGRIAANNIAGIKEKFEGTQGTSIVKIFDISVAVTGNNERILKRNNIEFERSFTHSGSHAGYYPGAMPLSIKILFSKETGKIYGASIVGYDGVDKRMDVIATAIRAGLTVHDLEKLELAYAPPYSSAKDPVNIAGFTAANIIKGDCNIFHWDQLTQIDMSKSMIIDVRTPMEFSLGSIQGAINIPVDDLRKRMYEIPKEKDVYILCQVGLRGYVATRILMQNGYESVKNLSGGYKTYHLAVAKQSNEDIFEYEKITQSDEIMPVDCNGYDCKEKMDVEVDACGLQCPGPIMQTFNAIKAMNIGDILKIKASDPGFTRDIQKWCERTGNKLISLDTRNNVITAIIKKGVPQAHQEKTSGNDKTMVVFSGDLDKAIASFIIANGAVSMGRKVTLFFTFWGLNILRKNEKVKVKKDLLSNMFGMMMPRGSKNLKLSRMSMGGIGGGLIRHLMVKKNVGTLEDMIEQAKANGIELVACNMSMDLMGIKKEELIDGVTIGGVATFLGSAEDSDMSLFI